MAVPHQVRPCTNTKVPLADACVTEWREAVHGTRCGNVVPLADACVTEWRSFTITPAHACLVPLADACVTEWRHNVFYILRIGVWCHSLMPVLLNGGSTQVREPMATKVPLADACVTEWRLIPQQHRIPLLPRCHSLMPVLLNGGFWAAL